jgi:hypothetical protein
MKNTDGFAEWKERLEEAILARTEWNARIMRMEHQLRQPIPNDKKGAINNLLREAKREKAFAEEEIKHLYSRILALREES